jgi:hypothetical protein
LYGKYLCFHPHKFQAYAAAFGAKLNKLRLASPVISAPNIANVAINAHGI